VIETFLETLAFARRSGVPYGCLSGVFEIAEPGASPVERKAPDAALCTAL
jgi:hypothetical protein